MNTEKVNQHLIGKSYREIVDNIEIVEDGVDCCGWAGCEITHMPEGVDLDSLVLKDCVQIDYAEDDFSRTVLNFVFADGNEGEVILGYELSAGSGSGWSYGAYVSLKLGDEELASASW